MELVLHTMTDHCERRGRRDLHQVNRTNRVSEANRWFQLSERIHLLWNRSLPESHFFSQSAAFENSSAYYAFSCSQLFILSWHLLTIIHLAKCVTLNIAVGLQNEWKGWQILRVFCVSDNFSVI